MLKKEQLVMVSELSQDPGEMFRRGLAVVDLSEIDSSANKLTQEIARFAIHLDGKLPREVDVSPRRLTPPDEDMAQMDFYGRKLADMVEPVTSVRVGALLRARFLVYDEVGATTGEHIDDPLDDDHAVSIGLTAYGLGALRCWRYSRPGLVVPSERTPIRLAPGVAVLQPGQTQVEHSAESLDPYRVVGVWDYAHA